MTFTTTPLRPGLLFDLAGSVHPSVAQGWCDSPLTLEEGTHFGFVQIGPARLDCQAGSFSLGAGLYFAVPGAARVQGGMGLAITRLGYQGLFSLGGPIEERGRLQYIDGCTDSLLLAPVLRGDPCLNLLHLPPGTRQSRHTHPSDRVGLVVRGAGTCLTDAGAAELRPGLAFLIPTDLPHCFHTEDSELLIVAYHPDSDFGPTHQDHPMINRTLRVS